jgi:hypothetical protein
VSGDWVPARAVGVWTRKSGDRIVLEGYIDVYETNLVGGFIWSQCAVGLTIGGIAQKVAENYGVPLERAQASTRRFLDELLERGFVSKEVPDAS